jgi:hypothetical protein
MQTKTLATHADLSLVQSITSGDCWITNAAGDCSVALSAEDRAAIIADPSRMEHADLDESRSEHCWAGVGCECAAEAEEDECDAEEQAEHMAAPHLVAIGSTTRLPTGAPVVEYVLAIAGEGETGDRIVEESIEAAIERAEYIISQGDYELSPGESTTVRYWLTPVGEERGAERSVEIER